MIQPAGSVGTRAGKGLTAGLFRRRRRPKQIIAAVLLAAILLLVLASCAGRSTAGARLTEPESELSLGFPADFPDLTDVGGNGAGEPITGFGGSRDERTGRRPVILIHGNGTPAEEIWRHYRHWLEQSGYGSGDIWALNYLGERGGAEGATPFRDNMADVRVFIDAVIQYLQVDRVDLVAVSLGCHLARGYVLGARLVDDNAGAAGDAAATSNDTSAGPGEEATDAGDTRPAVEAEAELVFDPDLRRGDRVGSMILISGANYGLGTSIDDPDWNSESELWSTTVENSFLVVDGRVDHTPYADQIHYATVAAEFDYPETLYRLGDRPAAAWRTTSLEGAVNQIVGPDEGLGYPDSRARDGNFANHRQLVRDPFVFATYVLPHLNID